MSTAYAEFSGRMGPLLFLVILGFIAGRWGKIDKTVIARLLIYFLTPAMVASGILKGNLDWRNILIPLTFFILCSVLAFVSLVTYGKFWVKDRPDRHMGALGAGDANSGYFAIPVGSAVFGEGALPYIVLISMGFVLYENSVGYFLAARGKLSLKASIKRVSRLPAVYAVVAAMALKLWGIPPLPDRVVELGHSFRMTYSVLGMMLLGMGLSTLKSFDLDWRFLSSSLFAKFVVWPLTLFCLTTLGINAYLGIPEEYSRLLIFTGFLPMAANMVAISAEVGVSVEKSATAVFLSLLTSWILLPLVFS